MQRSTIITLAIVALMAVPTGVASWMNYGDREPSTVYDVTAGRMFTTPDVRPPSQGLRAYFNFFQSNGEASVVQPNVAALGTRLQFTPAAQYHAMLGVWKDCNHDGYIGQAETALLEYRAEVLSAQAGTTTCPVDGSDGDFVFNDGLWVREFIYFGRADPCTFENATNRAEKCGGIAAFRRNGAAVQMNHTLVWYDGGIPGQGGASGSCPISPLPHGTLSRTGGIISYAECFHAYQDTKLVNTVADATGNPGGLKFSDPNHPLCSDGLLNPDLPTSLFGDQCTGQTGLLQYQSGDDSFKVFDCQSGTGYNPVQDDGVVTTDDLNPDDPTAFDPTATTVDPSKLTVDPLNNRTVAPAVLNPLGSYWDAFTNVEEATEQDCDESTLDTIVGGGDLSPEGDVSSQLDAKAADIDFMNWFGGGGRGQTQSNPAPGRNADVDAAVGGVTAAYNDTMRSTFGPRFPSDAGLGSARGTLNGPQWQPGTNWVQTPQSINRNTNAPDRPRYWTAYARLDHAELSKYGITLPTFSQGTYGGAQCSNGIGPGQPDQNGWVCDPTRWYLNVDTGNDEQAWSAGSKQAGNTKTPDPWQMALEAVVGDSFDLQDTDCLDGHLATAAGAEVQASLTQVPDPVGGTPGSICAAV